MTFLNNTRQIILMLATISIGGCVSGDVTKESIDPRVMQLLTDLAHSEAGFSEIGNGIALPNRIVTSIQDPLDGKNVDYAFRLMEKPALEGIPRTSLSDRYVYLSERKLKTIEVAMLFSGINVESDDAIHILADNRLHHLNDSFAKTYGDDAIDRLRGVISNRDNTFVLSDMDIIAVCSKSMSNHVGLYCRAASLFEIMKITGGNNAVGSFWWGGYSSGPNMPIRAEQDDDFLSGIENAASFYSAAISPHGFYGAGLGSPELAVPNRCEVSYLRRTGKQVYDHSYFVMGVWPENWTWRSPDKQVDLNYAIVNRQVAGPNVIGRPNSLAAFRLAIQLELVLPTDEIE